MQSGQELETEDDDGYESDGPDAGFGWSFVAWIDMALGHAGELLARTLEFCEIATHVVLGALAFALMPWRWYERDVADDPTVETNDTPSPLLQKLVGLRDMLLDWIFGGVFETFFFAWNGVGELIARYTPRWIFWPFHRGLDISLGIAEVSSEFTAGWWYSRDFRKLLFAAPAALLVVVVAGYATAGFLQSDAIRIKRYQDSLAEAEASADVDRKALIKKKLEQLGGIESHLIVFRAASELASAGKVDEAFAKMEGLAPLDAPGLLPAHLWIAGAYLDNVITPLESADRWQLIKTHVKHALQLSKGESVLAQRFQVEVLMHEGNVEDALPLMETIVEKFPELHASLAHEYHLRGEDYKARRHAKNAVQRHQASSKPKSSNVELSDTDEHEVMSPYGYLRMAELHKLAGDHEAERHLLLEGSQRYPKSEILNDILGRVTESALKKLKLTDRHCKSFVESVCRKDPANSTVVHLLARGLTGANRFAVDPASELVAAEEIVQHLKEVGALSANVLQLAGDYCLVRGKSVEAAKFYRRACDHDESASFAWNNLAAVLSNMEPRDLSQALAAANRAIALNPDPRFYDTRGQIFVQLRQWENAIEDLEMAVSGSIPNAADAHRSLVSSYEAIGQTEQARAHQSLLNSF